MKSLVFPLFHKIPVAGDDGVLFLANLFHYKNKVKGNEKTFLSFGFIKFNLYREGLIKSVLNKPIYYMSFFLVNSNKIHSMVQFANIN